MVRMPRVFGSVAMRGSTQKASGMSTSCPGVERLLLEAEAGDLVEVLPTTSGVTL
jgi:hypothetical protein